jgi:hypothetical protein
MSSPTTIVELRRYALHPAQRESLVALFEERFIESQEEVGMTLLGQLGDLDDPDSFVWLRGFSEHGQPRTRTDRLLRWTRLGALSRPGQRNDDRL